MSDPESEADEVVTRWWEAVGRGEAPPLETLLRENPRLADAIRLRAAGLALLDQAFGSAVAGRPRRPSRRRAGDPRARRERIGPYRILEELGAGGMGTVYRAEVVDARDGLEPGRIVALKVIHPHLLDRRGGVERFHREAEVGRRIVHPNVVRTLALGTARRDGKEVPYLVMEHVAGQTLRSLLDELEQVPEELCRHVGRQVAGALAAVHAAGAVHRDVKPENVLITKDQDVKVMDLGVVCVRGASARLSRTGDFVGSVDYAAPEQLRGRGSDVDGRADLYALGLTLYEISTGHHALTDPSASLPGARDGPGRVRPAAEWNARLSPLFEEVLQCLLEPERERRFGSARDLARVLEEGEESAWWKHRAAEIRARTRRPLRRIRLPRETALHGRGEEVARLRGWFADAKAGRGRAVLVQGEAGIGKSRLVDEFVGALQREGEDVSVLIGGHPPGGAATATGAFRAAFAEHVGDHEGTLRALLPATPLLVPAFRALLRGDTAPEGTERLTQDSLQDLIVQATRSLAAERPTILWIEDLHFAPPEGLALFSAVAHAAEGHRILLLGTTRPGPEDRWSAESASWPQVARLPVPRLRPEDVRLLLSDALRNERLARDLCDLIAARSDGNPYFVFEVLQGLREGRYLVQAPDGVWHAEASEVVPTFRVPSSIRDLVQARVAAVDESERRLLDAASCLGFEFDPNLVGAAFALGPLTTLQAFARIENRHRLVRSAGRRYVFDHHQVQEVLYAALPEPLREQYHGAIAGAIEARHDAARRDPGTLEGAVCADLSEHLLKGGQGARALRYLDAALAHLDRHHRNDPAIRLADAALATPELAEPRRRCEILLAKARPLDLLGRREEEARCLAEAGRLADEAGDASLRAAARSALGWHLVAVCRLAEARGVLDEAVRLSEEIGDRGAEARARRSLGYVFKGLGLYEQVREQHERSRVLCRDLGDRRGEAAAMCALGTVYHALGRYGEARAQLERSLALSREAGERLRAARALGDLGEVLASEGRQEEARSHFESSLALCREVGDRLGEAFATGNLGDVLSRLGRHEEARALYDRQLALAHAIRHRWTEARGMGNLGGHFQARGRLAAARAHAERSLALFREVGDRDEEARATLRLGAIARSLGRRDEARKHLDCALAEFRAIGARWWEGAALEELAALADEGADAAEAERLSAGALEIWRAIGHRSGAVETLRARGLRRARDGQREAARRDLREARRLADQSASGAGRVRARVTLACLLGEDLDGACAAFEAGEPEFDVIPAMEARLLLGRATRQARHLALARRWLDLLLSEAPSECRESMVRGVHLHWEVAGAAPP